MDRRTLKRIASARYARYSAADRRTVVVCVVCEEFTTSWDLHEALVKRSAVSPAKQDLIFCAENCVPLCKDCHMSVGQTADTAAKSLLTIATHYSAEAVMKWYVSLWKEHEIPVPKGFVRPEKTFTVAQALASFLPLGARITGLEMTDDESVWMMNPGTKHARDFRALCVLHWQGKVFRKERKQYRAPLIWRGYNRADITKALREGYAMTYLCDVLDLEIERCLVV
jgi:hypothetical protein